MGDMHCSEELAVPKSFFRVLSRAIFIFNSVIRLLGEPEDEDMRVPDPASIPCIRNMLDSLGVRSDHELSIRADLDGYLAVVRWNS
jgi:hypothetical protein